MAMPAVALVTVINGSALITGYFSPEKNKWVKCPISVTKLTARTTSKPTADRKSGND